MMKKAIKEIVIILLVYFAGAIYIYYERDYNKSPWLMSGVIIAIVYSFFKIVEYFERKRNNRR